ncbi:DNA mismatch repair protein MutS [Adhaeribacter sp. BT258]|uniref:DNA mismatch repair protein MutS n=1 Tax=Adhaeribacter terrigena TaxID=2793070 RepID=A0ABS1C565_9BACT|nr:DNA mismatch repair protein MutS [Adhaeribacter terrigena]MBK0404507.1 DNA mismatch repair protein MutS [Adhaeribacter terrigena]
MFGSKEKALFLKNCHLPKTDSFNFGKIARYFSKSTPENATQVISDKTYHDLDLDEVFMMLDRTVSKVGQQYLYNAFRTIPANENRSKKTEALINIFKQDAALKQTVLNELYRLRKPEAYYIASLFQEKHLQKPKWFWLVPVLSALSFLSVLLTVFYPPFIVLLLVLLAGNFIIHYWNKNNLFQYTASIPQLLTLQQVTKKLLKTNAFNKTDKLQDAVLCIDKLGKHMRFFALESKMEGDFSQLGEAVLEIIKALFLFEPILLFHVLKKLEKHRPQLEELFTFVGEIDTVLTIDAFRSSLPYSCYPEFFDGPEKHLQAAEIYHPLIPGAVANSIHLENRSALLTGSNMSGKTTFIRTIGINTILGQTLNFCCARSFCLPRLHVHSAIRISDDLLSEKSYYFEEVASIKQMLNASRQPHPNLFMLDELFKGTNTTERIAAGKAVLRYLNQKSNLVFIATHDLELTDYLQEGYNLYHFSETVENGGIHFDYKLKTGNLKTTNAIRILELNNYPAEVIAEAKMLSEARQKVQAGKVY